MMHATLALSQKSKTSQARHAEANEAAGAARVGKGLGRVLIRRQLVVRIGVVLTGLEPVVELVVGLRNLKNERNDEKRGRSQERSKTTTTCHPIYV